MIILIVALLIGGFIFPPLWLVLVGYLIYIFASKNSRRDNEVEKRIRAMIASSADFALFSELYFDAAKSYADAKGSQSDDPGVAVAKVVIDNQVYRASFMRSRDGGTEIRLMRDSDFISMIRKLEVEMSSKTGGANNIEDELEENAEYESLESHENGSLSFDYVKNSDVSREKLQEALNFFIELEHFANNNDSLAYDDLCQDYKKEIEAAESAIKWFASSRQPMNLDDMQELYYSITNSEENRISVMHISVVTSTINYCWDGIGPWKM